MSGDHRVHGQLLHPVEALATGDALELGDTVVRAGQVALQERGRRTALATLRAVVLVLAFVTALVHDQAGPVSVMRAADCTPIA